MNHIHVQTHALRQSANGLTEAAKGFGPVGHWLDNSHTAADGMSAWDSGPALKDCADAWQAHVKAVVDQLHLYSTQLHDSAHSYDQADQEYARRLDAALGDLGGAATGQQP